MAASAKSEAVGIGANMIISVFLLPPGGMVKSKVQSPKSKARNRRQPITCGVSFALKPSPATLNASSFYRPGCGISAWPSVRILPVGLGQGILPDRRGDLLPASSANAGNGGG